MHRVLLLAILPILLSASHCMAEDFRIETRVFAGDDPTAVSENTTLFHAGKVYDYLADPTEITVFDKQRSRLILLDPSRRMLAEVKEDELLEFSATLQGWAGKQTDPLLKFAAMPRFDQSLDASSGDLSFSSRLLNYQVKVAKTPSETAAAQFREFSDMYARLNAITHPGGLPPFPRLQVNEAVAKNASIPEEVRLSIPARRIGGKPIDLRSEHRMQWRLLEGDRVRIQETGEFLVTFTPVSLRQFLNRPASAE
jgi:hypothetical protein